MTRDDPIGQPVRAPIHNDETDANASTHRFYIRAICLTVFLLSVPVLGLLAARDSPVTGSPADLRGAVPWFWPDILSQVLARPAPLWAGLPPAPQGWLRVTPGNAGTSQSADAMTALAQRWPGGITALRRHPASASLTRYLTESAGQPLAPQVRRWEASAMYLHPSGQALRVDLNLLAPGRALGPKGYPILWQEALPDWLDRTHNRTGGTMAPITVAGHGAISQYTPRRPPRHRTPPEPGSWQEALIGKDNRPIAADGWREALLKWRLLQEHASDPRARPLVMALPRGHGDLFNGPFRPGSTQWVALDVTVPVAARAVLRFRGVASPWMVATLLRATDVTALSALTDGSATGGAGG